MIVLIPFQILKLRYMISEDEPAEEKEKALNSFVYNDILGSIKANEAVGNITADDALEIKELCGQLLEYAAKHYRTLRGCQNIMKPLLDGAMELPNDKYRFEIDELKQEKAKIEREKAEVTEENRKLRAQIEELMKHKK